MTKQIYFLGGTSPSGFQSKFLEQIKAPGFYTYILKGGPGTGKSTLKKKISNEFKEHPISLYYCSSDIRSLDAVVIEDKKLIIVDGTAPHVFEALYPGASQEIINLGEFWDGNKLKKHSDAIHYLFDENQKYHARVRCYIEALASLNSDIYTIGEDALNKEKLISYISRFCKKLMIKNKKDEKGKISYKQISAFTTDNYSTQSLIGDYSVYLIKDDLFAGSDFFLRAIADHFVNCGYNITVSECTMHHIPTYEHIISEETGLAFMTSNFFNRIENFCHLTTSVQSGRSIFSDFFLNFIVYSNFLTVYNFFYSLAVFIFAGNFCHYCYFIEIIFLFHSQRDKTFCCFTDFFCFRLSCNDLYVVKQSSYLISDQCFSLAGCSAEFSIFCYSYISS